MQLDRESNKQLYRLIDTVLKEACYDYSYSSDLAVVNINGVPMLFNKNQLSMLHVIKRQVKKEIEND